MKAVVMQVLQSVAMGTVIPGLLFSAVKTVDPPFVQEKPVAQVQQSTKQEPEPELVQPEPPLVQENHITVPVLKSDGKRKEMDLEDYICRVVLGEMPASFEVEALKAQAVAARTYTLRCLGGEKHENGSICTSSKCCQAYCEPEGYIKNGGTYENVKKVFEAVLQTSGQVIYYEDKLIMATYFSSAGGSTEDAQAVWGNAFPYLTTVKSPEGDNRYNGEKVTFSADEFQEKLGLSLKGKPESWFGAVNYTVGGGVDQIRIGGTLFKGTAVREMLGLRSTDFTITTTESAVIFTTNGYGHRVGLSQYGADAMAATGSNYEQILLHYYTGTHLGLYSPVSD